MHSTDLMTVTLRSAQAADAAALCDIINPIIRRGGATAHQTPFDRKRMLAHYVAPEDLISTVVAELDGRPRAFQTLIWPSDEGDPLPSGWAIIASFVDGKASGRGIGRAMMDETRRRASEAGVVTIDATIRADNAGGLAFYSAMGFVDYDLLPAVPLRDGRRVDRIRKRLDL